AGVGSGAGALSVTGGAQSGAVANSLGDSAAGRLMTSVPSSAWVTVVLPGARLEAAMRTAAIVRMKPSAKVWGFGCMSTTVNGFGDGEGTAQTVTVDWWPSRQ